jgi:hypothetical protein
MFMQEMIELSKTQSTIPATQLQVFVFNYIIHCSATDFHLFIFQSVSFTKAGSDFVEILEAGPSHFGPELNGDQIVNAQAILVSPPRLCSSKRKMVWSCFVYYVY